MKCKQSASRRKSRASNKDCVRTGVRRARGARACEVHATQTRTNLLLGLVVDNLVQSQSQSTTDTLSALSPSSHASPTRYSSTHTRLSLFIALSRCPQSTLKRIHREIADLKKEDLGSIKLAPSDDDLFRWTATIPGPDGSVYESGLFHVDITLAPDYPSVPTPSSLSSVLSPVSLLQLFCP